MEHYSVPKYRAPGINIPEPVRLHEGAIPSVVAGRTDHLPVHVASGSYVLPADIVSAHGEGNTAAGFAHMRRLFGGTPYGGGAGPYGQSHGLYGMMAKGGMVRLPSSSSLDIPAPPTKSDMDQHSRVQTVPLHTARSTQTQMDWGKNRRAPGPLISGYADKPVAVRKENGEHLIYDGHHRTVAAQNAGMRAMEMHVIPAIKYAPEFAGRPPARQGMSDEEMLSELGKASGGKTSADTQAVPVVVAGGEYILNPDQVRTVGEGDIDKGHKVLDGFVNESRAKLVSTLRKLPPPSKN